MKRSWAVKFPNKPALMVWGSTEPVSLATGWEKLPSSVIRRKSWELSRWKVWKIICTPERQADRDSGQRGSEGGKSLLTVLGHESMGQSIKISSQDVTLT